MILLITFIIGFLLLLFGKNSSPIYDIVGFILITIAFIGAMIT